MPYGNPVAYALNNLSNNLGTGLAGLGQARADKARLALEQGLLQRQMRLQDEDRARQQQTYELGLPAQQLSSQNAQAELSRRNAPVTVAAIFPDMDALDHAVYKSKGEKHTLAEKIGHIFNANLDLDHNSKTYGQYVKKDGTVLTMGEVEANAPSVQGLIAANYDVKKGLRDQFKKGARLLEQLKQKDPQLKSPEAQEAIAKLGKLEQAMKNPQVMIDAIDSQINMLTRFKGEEYEKGIQRLEKDKAALYKLIPKEMTAKEKQEIETSRQRGLLYGTQREKLQHEMTGGGKGGKLTFDIDGQSYTQEQANKEMTALGNVLKDYDSDAIINYGSIANIEGLGSGEKQTILERISQIAETAKNPRVQQAANKYLQLAEARGWFQSEKPKTLPTAPEGMPESAMQSVVEAGGKTVEFGNGKKYKFDAQSNKVVEVGTTPKTGLVGVGKPGEAQPAEIPSERPQVKTTEQSKPKPPTPYTKVQGVADNVQLSVMGDHYVIKQPGGKWQALQGQAQKPNLPKNKGVIDGLTIAIKDGQYVARKRGGIWKPLETFF